MPNGMLWTAIVVGAPPIGETSRSNDVARSASSATTAGRKYLMTAPPRVSRAAIVRLCGEVVNQRRGRPDVLPVDDLGVRRGFQQTYGLGELPKPEEMQRIAEPWRPYRSAGTWYMWRSLGVALPEEGR